MNSRVQLFLILLVAPPAVLFGQQVEPLTAQPQAGGAQATPSQPPTTQPGREPIMAEVIELTGDVQYAELGSREWKPVKVGDKLGERTKVRTGVRSSVKLMIGETEPYTAVVIEAVGLTVLGELYETPDTKRVHLGVGYGRVRAGVAESGLKSDFTIDSPVATLSKRGTWGFSIYYERLTDRFEAGLTDRGLIEVLDKIRAKSRTLSPREAVTQVMRRWLDEVQMRRNVPMTDIFGQEDVEIAFNRLLQDGLGVVAPGSGQTRLLELSSHSSQTAFSQALERALQHAPPPMGVVLTPPGPQTFTRPEGFFGTGRGDDLIPLLIDQNSSLAKSGAARPGKYLFRRSAVESWLSKHGQRR
jgi:hypothetical protein